MTVTQAPPSAIGQGGRIFIFGFLSAIAPLSIDIYLPALPTMRAALARQRSADALHAFHLLHRLWRRPVAVRTADRPLRAETPAHLRACGLYRRIRRLRAGAEHHHAHTLSLHPGARRRHRSHHRAGHGARPLCAQRKRPHPVAQSPGDGLRADRGAADRRPGAALARLAFYFLDIGRVRRAGVDRRVGAAGNA